MGKARDKISETHEAVDKQKEMARDIMDGKKEAAREVGDSVANAVGKARESVSHKAHDAKESTEEYVEKAKDVGETIGVHIVRNVSEEAEDVEEAVKSGIGYLVSEEILGSLMGVIHLLGFATAYGLCVWWITFVSSYVLARAIPRQQFGVVQSKIYPVYFRVMAYCDGMALVGHVLGQRKRFSSKAEMLQVYNLVYSHLTVLVNSIYLEPRATKLMFEKMKIEKEEGRGREDISTEPSREEKHQQSAGHTDSPTTAAARRRSEDIAMRCRMMRVNEKLKRLNSASSFLNIMSLMSLAWHMIYLAQRLHHHSHCIE